MKNKWTVLLVVFALLFGMVIGSAVFPQTRIKYVQEEEQLNKHIPYIEILEENGFRLENRSMEDSVWITPKTFTMFVDLARWYDKLTIFCSRNTRGEMYFWFMYDATSAVRWDIP